MPDIYRNTPLNKSPQITILSYAVELDDVYSADDINVDRRHVRTDEFIDNDILIARILASEYYLKESKRLKEEVQNIKDSSRHLGLMLYYTFKHNVPKNSDECTGCERIYLIDGEGCSQLEFLERLQQEYYHLIMAGVEFDSIEVEMGGETYLTPLGGLFKV